MDQISIKTPNPECHLYWCLIEFVEWRYSQSCWYFRTLLGTSAPLTFSLVLSPVIPPPHVFMFSTIHTACNGGGGEGNQVVWRSSTGVYTAYLTRFRTYKIALPLQTKTSEGRGPERDQHLPPNPFTGQFLRKDDL
jgi:hypothetical protein